MPARLAAMPRTPAERGAGGGGGGSAIRVAERLDRSVVVRTGTGLAVSAPLKLIVPNSWGARGACAAEGVLTVTPRATAMLPRLVGAVAEAGRASEAAIAPDMTITADTLVAGTAEREIAAVRDEAGLGAPAARWRPAAWFDKW